MKSNMILAGHGRLAAATALGLSEVPVIVLEGLSEAKKRALLLADNKITENAGWDREAPRHRASGARRAPHRGGLDISITGFEPVEIDQIAHRFRGGQLGSRRHRRKRVAGCLGGEQARRSLGARRASPLCGDARMWRHSTASCRGERAAMAFLDPPYNVRVKSVVGRGRIKHARVRHGLGRDVAPASSPPFWRKRSGTPPASPATARSISSAWTGGMSAS